MLDLKNLEGLEGLSETFVCLERELLQWSQRWKIVLEIEVFSSRKKYNWGFPGSTAGKESACNAGDPGSIPGSGRSPGNVIGYLLQYSCASLAAQMVKNPPTMWETWVQSLSWEDPLEEGMATHCGESPWTEEPGKLQFMGSQVGHNWATKQNMRRKLRTFSTGNDNISLVIQ